METLHSFLSSRYKQNGLTVIEFCKKIGISRQKFYRMIKEPARFPAESVQGIINVLSLNEEEARQLRSYLDPLRQKDRGHRIPRTVLRPFQTTAA